MRTARHSQRGAASVEAAISMLVIIPAFLYALFLDDLLRYAADQQEAVLSTPWDFITQDYTKPGTQGLKKNPSTAPIGGATEVQHQARLMFCDHESSGDSYDQGQDCDAEDHHNGKALSGHVCWLNDGAHQVTCEDPDTSLGGYSDPVFSGYKSKFGDNGGLFECHGQEVVENYLMPKGFLQEFAGTTELAKKNWSKEGSGVHDNAKAGAKQTAYYLAPDHFAVMVDPWALNEPNMEIKPGTKSGLFYDRVEHVYKGNLLYALHVAATTNFLTQASQELLMPGVGFAPPTDNPLTPNLSLQAQGTSPPNQPIKQDTGTQNYFATPWKDWGGNPYERSWRARGKFYMGCTSAGGC